MQTKKKLKYNQPIIEQNQTNQAIKCLRNAVVLNYYEKIHNKQTKIAILSITTAHHLKV